MKKNEAWHRLLSRQMQRLNLQENVWPKDSEAWLNFLKSVNNAYIEADQDRYLMERSMEISSEELLELNEKHRQAEKEILQLHDQLLDLVRTTGEEDISMLHQRLLSLAREAGMADVATSILHNVGNILSSTNTSLNLLEENISQPYYLKCLQLFKLLKENSDNLNHYLTQDAKGKLIPQYLVAISDILDKEFRNVVIEIKNLKGYLEHIKDIIAKQQSLARVSSFSEKVNVSEIIDTALQISGLLNKREITLEKNYQNISPIIIDKTKLLQILVNLINNAKEALKESPENTKKIEVNLEAVNPKQFSISVSDNGMGVDPENLAKIFSFGYTTKENGHGFGLHNCALVAREMGGKLTVKSEGINQGATFTLILPTNSTTQEESYP